MENTTFILNLNNFNKGDKLGGCATYVHCDENGVKSLWSENPDKFNHEERLDDLFCYATEGDRIDILDENPLCCHPRPDNGNVKLINLSLTWRPTFCVTKEEYALMRAASHTLSTHESFMEDVRKELNAFLEAHPHYSLCDIFYKKSVWNEALVWTREHFGQKED